jgi:hypothetical protein
VVSVSLLARLTDAVVDGDIDVSVQKQSEDVWGGERVVLLTPIILSLPASTDRAADLRHAKVAGSGRSQHSQHSKRVGRRADGVSTEEEFRGAPNKVIRRVA